MSRKKQNDKKTAKATPGGKTRYIPWLGAALVLLIGVLLLFLLRPEERPAAQQQTNNQPQQTAEQSKPAPVPSLDEIGDYDRLVGWEQHSDEKALLKRILSFLDEMDYDGEDKQIVEALQTARIMPMQDRGLSQIAAAAAMDGFIIVQPKAVRSGRFFRLAAEMLHEGDHHVFGPPVAELQKKEGAAHLRARCLEEVRAHPRDAQRIAVMIKWVTQSKEDEPTKELWLQQLHDARNMSEFGERFWRIRLAQLDSLELLVERFNVETKNKNPQEDMQSWKDLVLFGNNLVNQDQSSIWVGNQQSIMNYAKAAKDLANSKYYSGDQRRKLLAAVGVIEKSLPRLVELSRVIPEGL